MTLLTVIAAAVICIAARLRKSCDKNSGIGLLCVILCFEAAVISGVTVFDFIKNDRAFSVPSAGQMLRDAYLGLGIVAVGLIVWLIINFIKNKKSGK